MTDHTEVIPPEQLVSLTAQAVAWLTEHWYRGESHECPHCHHSLWDVRVASLALVQACCRHCGYVAILDGQLIFPRLAC